MNKLKLLLNPDIVKLIQSQPIIKKRTAFHFFTEEIKKNAERKYKRTEISQLWHKMDPESKRIYFTMAETDDVRFKEQISTRLAKIGSLLNKCDENGALNQALEHTDGSASSNELDNINNSKYQKYYSHMIQANSTSELYKDVIKKTTNLNLSTDKLISAVPITCRPVLIKPRKPVSAFALFTWLKRDELMELKAEQNASIPFLAFVSKEWFKLSNQERAVYYEKYEKSLEEYKEAMDKFKTACELAHGNDTNPNSVGDVVEESKKEKKAFRKSLRRKLRGSGLAPINVRNAFNFFLMENKSIPMQEALKIWRQLPEMQKAKYRLLTQQDLLRYHKEKLAYNEFLTKLRELK